ncbi:MAG TPA: cbb3-type cytochrome c oxidase subunit I [Candidatus Dormibacteraeota bacterium]
MSVAKARYQPAAGPSDEGARVITYIWLVTGAVVLLLLALGGLLMRSSQAFGLASPRVFYGLLTFHGAGMVGTALMVLAAVYWYVMRKALPLSVAVMRVVYVVFMVGAVLIIASTLTGFGTGWTFLYPLPAIPGPSPGWPVWGAVLFLVGLALVVVAYTIWCLDFLRAGLSRFGSLGRLLGVDLLFSNIQPGPATTDPSIVAGTVVAIGGVVAAIPGAIVVILELLNIFIPDFKPSALLAKNLIFFAGHMLVNVQIYTGAGLAYALLPIYARRPWKASKVLVAGWLVAVVFVMLAFFHHLYQDFAQPNGVQVIGEIASFGVAFPPIVVTIFGAVLLVYRSGMRWNAAPMFLYAAFAGWAIGGWAAEVGDATPVINQYFHNTVWVPAHFHTYMALGVILFLLGGVYHVMPEITGRSMSETIGRRAGALVLIGGWGPGHLLVHRRHDEPAASLPDQPAGGGYRLDARRDLRARNRGRRRHHLHRLSSRGSEPNAGDSFDRVSSRLLAQTDPIVRSRQRDAFWVLALAGLLALLAGPSRFGQALAGTNLAMHMLVEHTLLLVAGILGATSLTELVHLPRLPGWLGGAALAGFGSVLVVWHTPVMFDAAATMPPLHALMHLSYLAAGGLLLIGWRWSSPFGRILFFLLTQALMSVLALAMTSGSLVYRAYPSSQTVGAGIAMLVGMQLLFPTVAIAPKISSAAGSLPLVRASVVGMGLVLLGIVVIAGPVT